MTKTIEETVATGRRKTAVSSVRIRPGSGKINVNGREMTEYFPTEFQRQTVLAPFEKVGGVKEYDLVIRASGGGINAQAEATRLGISRALVEKYENLHSEFKDRGFLTRDARMKERKKYGQPGARARFQFSKR